MGNKRKERGGGYTVSREALSGVDGGDRQRRSGYSLGGSRRKGTSLFSGPPSKEEEKGGKVELLITGKPSKEKGGWGVVDFWEHPEGRGGRKGEF